jgi:hypothetical protein
LFFTNKAKNGLVLTFLAFFPTSSCLCLRAFVNHINFIANNHDGYALASGQTVFKNSVDLFLGCPTREIIHDDGDFCAFVAILLHMDWSRPILTTKIKQIHVDNVFMISFQVDFPDINNKHARVLFHKFNSFQVISKGSFTYPTPTDEENIELGNRFMSLDRKI